MKGNLWENKEHKSNPQKRPASYKKDELQIHRFLSPK